MANVEDKEDVEDQAVAVIATPRPSREQRTRPDVGYAVGLMSRIIQRRPS